MSCGKANKGEGCSQCQRYEGLIADAVRAWNTSIFPQKVLCLVNIQRKKQKGNAMFKIDASKVARSEPGPSEEATSAALADWRSKVTDTSKPHDAPREDLHGMTAFEAALFGAGGDDLGDGVFHYPVAHGREDLASLIGGRKDLGALMTAGRLSAPTSIVARALQVQDGHSVAALLEAGATLAPGENPVKILMDGASNDAWSYTTDNDPIGIEESLKALKTAGHDIDAPIDGQPAAFYMAGRMVAHAVANEEIMGPGDTSNIARSLRAAASLGINFQARNGDGDNVVQFVEKSLGSEGRKLGEKDPLRLGIEDARAVSKVQNVRAATHRLIEAESAVVPERAEKKAPSHDQR